MTKGIKFFLVGLGISLGFCVIANDAEGQLQNFFLSQFYIPEITFLAQVSRELEPVPSPKLEIDVKAKSILVLELNDNGSQMVVFEKNSSRVLPIASLTKLMTAIVSLDVYSLSQEILITQQAVMQVGSSGNLRLGEKMPVRELLKMVLVESSNDAAFALSQFYGRDKFMNLMNLKAQEIGLKSTNFGSTTGLESENNYSTAQDLAVLMIYILRNNPQILEFSSQPTITVLDSQSFPHHLAKNTNELLGSLENSGKWEVLGSKTGYTQEAGGCIILALRNKKTGYDFIDIILGADSSDSRFSEMEKLIQNFN